MIDMFCFCFSETFANRNFTEKKNNSITLVLYAVCMNEEFAENATSWKPGRDIRKPLRGTAFCQGKKEREREKESLSLSPLFHYRLVEWQVREISQVAEYGSVILARFSNTYILTKI